MDVNAESGLPPVGAPPTVRDQGDGGEPEMLTKAEAKELAERKIKAVARQNKALEEENARFRAEQEKRRQAEMSKDELLAQRDAKIAELEKHNKLRAEAEAAELAEIEEENKEAAKQLKKLAPFVAIPEGLPPKSMAKWIRQQTALVSTETISVHGGGGRSKPLPTDEERRKARDADNASKGSAFIFGTSNKDVR